MHGGHCPNAGKPEAEWTTHEERAAARAKADIMPLAREIAEQLIDAAPPKVEGGSDSRRQWIADVLAIQIAFSSIPGGLDAFQEAMEMK
jgi:hypothetical protein